MLQRAEHNDAFRFVITLLDKSYQQNIFEGTHRMCDILDKKKLKRSI